MTLAFKTPPTLEYLDEQGWVPEPKYGWKIVLEDAVFIKMAPGSDTASNAAADTQVDVFLSHEDDPVPAALVKYADFTPTGFVTLRTHYSERAEKAWLLKGTVEYVAEIGRALRVQKFEAPASFYTIQEDVGRTGDPHLIYAPPEDNKEPVVIGFSNEPRASRSRKEADTGDSMSGEQAVTKAKEFVEHAEMRVPLTEHQKEDLLNGFFECLMHQNAKRA